MMSPHMQVEKPELVQALAENLGNITVLALKAQGHHWNVTGSDFAQFHEFFEELYTDFFAQVDPIAENMRKLGAVAPYQLPELKNLSTIEDMDTGSDAMKMVYDLYQSNNVMIASINKAFKLANDMDEQGIADYLAGRDDMHKKWRWQLQAFLGSSEVVEKSYKTEQKAPVVEQMMDDKTGCPLCGPVGCVCPGIEGGYCLCDEPCPCPQCHHVMMVDDEPEDRYTMFKALQEEALTSAGVVVAEEQDLADALIEITQKHGKFDSDDSGVWAGYESAEENENKDIGVKCANCILYVGGTECKILDHEVEPEGYCRFALIPDGVVTAAASRKAPKKDRIYGSKRNPKGSASGGKKIVFSQKTEKALRNKVEEHNKNAKEGRRATLPMLKAVYRRGSGAYSSSHRPGKTRDQWAMARVNAFLKLLRSGSPSNPNYKQDNDLLPKAHPKSSKGEAAVIQHELLQVALKSADEYGSPEHAIFSMAEYSGLGYEIIPALRGAWLRGVRDGDVPFNRAYELATKLYRAKDADLLPKRKKKVDGDK